MTDQSNIYNLNKNKKLSVVIVMFSVMLALGISACKETVVTKLSPSLYGLVSASDREGFAKGKRIKIHNGRVEVIIETTFPSTEIEGYDIIIKFRQKNIIGAQVKVDDLISLSKESYVKFIRTPFKFFKMK